jgi:hypothetical protein
MTGRIVSRQAKDTPSFGVEGKGSTQDLPERLLLVQAYDVEWLNHMTI